MSNAVTPQAASPEWFAHLKQWLRRRPLMAVIVEVDADTGQVRTVRTETVEDAVAMLDALQHAAPTPNTPDNEE